MKDPIAMYPKNVRFFKDSNEAWRWKITADNGNIIGSSSEGYSNKQDAVYNFCSVGMTIIESRDFEKFFQKELKKISNTDGEK